MKANACLPDMPMLEKQVGSIAHPFAPHGWVMMGTYPLNSNAVPESICTSNGLSFLCRISVIFRVRSAKAVKITDMNLLKRLGVIVIVFSMFLIIRTLVAPPVVIVGRTADDLKAYLCQTNWWDHSFTTCKYTLNRKPKQFFTT